MSDYTRPALDRLWVRALLYILDDGIWGLMECREARLVDGDVGCHLGLEVLPSSSAACVFVSVPLLLPPSWSGWNMPDHDSAYCAGSQSGRLVFGGRWLMGKVSRQRGTCKKGGVVLAQLRRELSVACCMLHAAFWGSAQHQAACIECDFPNRLRPCPVGLSGLQGFQKRLTFLRYICTSTGKQKTA